MNIYKYSLVIIGAVIAPFVLAAPIGDFQFKSPSFNGIGYGTYTLTIENEEFTRAQAIQQALEAAKLAAENAAKEYALKEKILGTKEEALSGGGIKDYEDQVRILTQDNTLLRIGVSLTQDLRNITQEQLERLNQQGQSQELLQMQQQQTVVDIMQQMGMQNQQPQQGMIPGGQMNPMAGQPLG